MVCFLHTMRPTIKYSTSALMQTKWQIINH